MGFFVLFLFFQPLTWVQCKSLWCKLHLAKPTVNRTQIHPLVILLHLPPLVRVPTRKQPQRHVHCIVSEASIVEFRGGRGVRGLRGSETPTLYTPLSQTRFVSLTHTLPPPFSCTHPTRIFLSPPHSTKPWFPLWKESKRPHWSAAFSCNNYRQQ